MPLVASSQMARADVAIAGAGPAGLMAAIAAAGEGADVVVCEKLPAVGAKLLATGGGRCNLTNTLPADEFIRRFGRAARFVSPALGLTGPSGLREFLARLGVATHAPDGALVYPVSNSARRVRDALARRAGEIGVRFLAGMRVRNLVVNQGRVLGVAAEGGGVECGAVVLATGGMSRPDLGSTGDGYALARAAGHAVAEPVPALVPLVTRPRWTRRCAGVAVARARVAVEAGRKDAPASEGELLFTHRGVSGPAALDVSGEAAAALAERGEATLVIDLAPGTDAAAWRGVFERWRRERGGSMMRTLLAERLPARLARALVRLSCPSEDARASRLAREEAIALAGSLSGLRLTATATEGFGKSMATRGGVGLGEVDPRTLESRLVRGLFFAGEVLDVDGPCGGFNLTWAFASGRLAGLHAARSGSKATADERG